MLEWLLAIGLLGAFLVLLLPRLLRGARRSQLKGGASGIVLGIGFALITLFDPRSAQAIEIVEQKREETEDEESGENP